jgi:rod shape determining protein RodA
MHTIRFYNQFDWFLLIILIALIVFGEIAIYSASIKRAGGEVTINDYYQKQLIWILLAVGFFFLVLSIPEAIMEVLVVPFYAFTLLLLIVVLFLPGVKGVHRWINSGRFGFQPSELAKLATILLTAKIISKLHMPHWKIVVYTFLIVLFPMVLLLREPDLGSTLIFLAFCFPMLYFAGVSPSSIFLIISPLISMVAGFSMLWWIVYDIILLIVLFKRRLSFVLSGFIFIGNVFISMLTPYFWSHLRDYQQERILAFLNPARDVLGSGYQIIQSKIAIGSGGMFGKGFLQGTQKNLAFLPEQHTDFIFSVIGEEFGFFGCSILILLFIALIWRGIYVFKKIQNKEKRLVIMGILSFLIFQVVVNIGMNLGILPVAGVPLPFISYGGSGLLVNVVAIGIIIKFERERSFIG